jgi:type I restriction enzyme S subunit
MRAKAVPSSWLERDGRRLDCNPYMSGALEAKLLLEGLRAKKDLLQNVCLGGRSGLVNAGRIKRLWVTDERYGIRFLSSTDILRADLSNLQLISKESARSNPKLLIQAGWTLITRAGTIGRMAYTRPDMGGLACSEDVLRVIPDAEKIPPGYLYAYLSSKFGVPIVIGGTYGAIIQHIEPEHIANLPVPRLGKRIEMAAHELVQEAARLRTTSSELLEKAKADTSKAWCIDPRHQLRNRDHPDLRIVSASTLAKSSRFDAFFHGSAAAMSDSILADIARRLPLRRIGDADVSRTVYETTRFGRISVDDPSFGVPFLSISDMMRGDPKAESYITKKQARQVNAVVHAGWLILPRVGQLQGVFGTVSYVAKHLDGVAVSDNNIRIVPLREDEGAYLWAALSTDLLYQQIIRRSCGTSIPYLDSKRVADIPVPWPSEKQRFSIAALVKEAMSMRSKASQQEGEAIHLVEETIRRGGN